MAAPTTGISVQGISILDASTGRQSQTQLLGPNEYEGRQTRAYFNIQLASQAVGTYGLLLLPKGARLIGGSLTNSVALGGTATVAIGLAGRDNSGFYATNTVSSLMTPPNALPQTDGVAVADNTGVLLAAGIINTVTNTSFNSSIATLLGYVTDKEVWVTFTVAAAAFPATGLITGSIAYSYY